MIVCHCYAVNDQRIRELIGERTTVRDIAKECGAGRDCGACIATVRSLLETSVQVAPVGA